MASLLAGISNSGPGVYFYPCYSFHFKDLEVLNKHLHRDLLHSLHFFMQYKLVQTAFIARFHALYQVQLTFLLHECEGSKVQIDKAMNLRYHQPSHSVIQGILVGRSLPLQSCSQNHCNCCSLHRSPSHQGVCACWFAK